MTTLISLHNALFDRISRAEFLVPTLARLTFIAVLLIYFWNSAMTKLGDGIFGFLSPSVGAYVQMFPKQMEAISYDVSQLGVFYWLVAVAGTWAEFILPFLLLIGLLTRLAAFGMIGFVVVQTIVDVNGHGVVLGNLFDNAPTLIDQRTMWIFLFLVIILKGAGPISADRLLKIS
ncbi:MAG: DoxX family membrane protein [Rhodobacteraceae bacterium]|nr:DoxX family membrane protein [Paracoccaceae bacterium]